MLSGNLSDCLQIFKILTEDFFSEIMFLIGKYFLEFLKKLSRQQKTFRVAMLPRYQSCSLSGPFPP